MKAQEQMVATIRNLMAAQGITQAELARRIGRTPKHVNKVLNGAAGSMELDYWLYVLGFRFVISVERIEQ